MMPFATAEWVGDTQPACIFATRCKHRHLLAQLMCVGVLTIADWHLALASAGTFYS